MQNANGLSNNGGMRRRYARAASVLLAWVLAVPAWGENGDALSASQIDQILKLAAAAQSKDNVPGMSIAVAKNGRVWSGVLGKADLEQDVLVTSQSKFRTASVAKWLTATAVMKLWEQGQLDLDAPIQRYCRQFPAKQWTVTTRRVLSHMAGVRHYHGANDEPRDTEAQRSALDAAIQRERANQYLHYTDVVKPLDAFKDDPLLFEPGTAHHYSSLGYRLLGCVVEGAAGMPYRNAMRELILTPALMSGTTEDDLRTIVPQRVAGYGKDFVGPGPGAGRLRRAAFRDFSENLPAGGYLTTAEDLVRFASAFHAGQLVATATRDRMVERPSLKDGGPAPLGADFFYHSPYYYGLGVMVDVNASLWLHTGGQPGASAILLLDPKTGVAVAVLANMEAWLGNESLAKEILAAAER